MTYQASVTFVDLLKIITIEIRYTDSINMMNFFPEQISIADLTRFYEKIKENFNENYRYRIDLPDYLITSIKDKLLLNESTILSSNSPGKVTIFTYDNQNKNVLIVNRSLIEAFENAVKITKKNYLENVEITKVISQGKFSEVYKGFNEYGNRVIIKTIKDRKIFEKEVKIMERISNDDYFLTIIDFIEKYKQKIILMEYPKHYKTLRYYINKNENGIFSIFNNLCKGLKVLHSYHIAHCNINPDNILVNTITGDIKYMNFEWGCIENECSKEKTDVLDYLDPKLFNNKKYGVFGLFKNYLYLSQQADLWSLGIVIYEVLTKKLPINYFDTPEEYFKEYSFVNDPKREFIKIKLKSTKINIDNLLSFSKRNYFCNY